MNWLKSWQWFHKADTLQLFLYLLVNANTEDKYWQGTLIKRGQIVTTIPLLAEVLDSTAKKVRNNLERLSMSNEIGRQTTNKYSIVTICNYDSYIGLEIVNGQTKGSQRADKGQSTKEINKENIPPTPPIKENNKEKYSSSTTMRAREEFIQVLKGDRIWGESVELRYQLQPGALIPWIERFALDIQCRDVAHKDIQDAKRHFFDWLRIQLRYEQRTTPTSKAGYLQAERERLQREIAELNENYIRQHPGEFPNDV